VGTGLGLNIAYNVVHKHYGDIQLESEPGETCFRVRLPQRLPK
jgi:signal transduction histidine kinase